MTMNRVSTALLAAALGLTTSACGEDENRPIYRSFDQDLVEVAQAQGLTEFLRVADLVGASNGLDIDTGNGTVLTLFAPTDAAFNGLDPGVRDALEANPSLYNKVFRFHALGGSRPSTVVTASVGGTLETVIGESITVQVDGGTVTLEGGPDLSGETTTANITTVDLYASNGIIHVIDSVLLPPLNIAEVATVAGLSSLVTAATDVELDGALTGPGPLTVFAPTNEAFAALGVDLTTIPTSTLSAVLAHHLVTGPLDDEGMVTEGQLLAADLSDGDELFTATGTLTVGVTDGMVTLTDGSGNTVNVIETDIRTLTGVVHLIDGVLIPATED